MSFASTLNGYLAIVNCTSREFAQRCGISPSTLSRYRKGERAPDADAAVVADLARGIAGLSEGPRSKRQLSEADVRTALEQSITGARLMGMDFNMRFDALMHLTGLSNAKMAEATQVDPSYISRIRKGTRKPGDLRAFTETASRMFAQICLEKDLLAEARTLLGDVTLERGQYGAGYDDNSDLAETIGMWLYGNTILEADVAELERLFSWLDETDFSEWLAIADEAEGKSPGPLEEPDHVARFYYGVDGMQSAEIDFFAMAAKTHARKLSMSSDMPLLHMDLDQQFVSKYKRGIARLLESGCHVTVVHPVERPLAETLQSMRLWIPFYLTGFVSPYFLRGIYNRVFYHVNYVCDTCALASEAMIGHQEDGRYFFSTRPSDVSYYQKKLQFILERSSQIIELYRDSVPEQREAFERAEAARRAERYARPIGKGRYKSLSALSCSSEVSLSLDCGSDVVHFVIRHPKVSYAASRMK